MEPLARVRLWGMISGLLVFGLAFTLWPMLGKMENVYLQAGLRDLPEATEAVLSYGFLLWIPAAAAWMLAAVQSGKDRPKAAAWFFWLAVAVVVVDVFSVLAVIYPLRNVQR